MHPEKKISPAFEPYLADSRRRDKHEAVVIYQAPTVKRPKRGREGLRLAETRVQYAAEQAELHKEVESRIFTRYLDEGDEALMMSPIGGSADKGHHRTSLDSSSATWASPSSQVQAKVRSR